MKLLTSVGNEITEIDLGRVKVGESKEFEFILFNEKRSRLEEIKIKFFAVTKNKDGREILKEIGDEIKVLKMPTLLRNQEKGNIKFRWTPTLEVESGLKAKIIITSLEVFG